MTRLRQPLAALLDRDHGDWQPLLQAWRSGEAGQSLIRAVDARVAAGASVFPEQVFRAFELTPLARTRVVILGQDPYHTPGLAEGLAFSVPAGQRVPPSLRNIFAELHRDLGHAPPASGSLVAWAERGVLLLNTVLTVEANLPGAHAKLGWRALTAAACAALVTDAAPKVFMLWGIHAQSLAPRLEGDCRHLVLQCNHPSPLAAARPPLPFVGCAHFSRANLHLAATGRGPVDWCLT